MEKIKQISVQEYEDFLNDERKNYIAMTFDGEIVCRCTGREARHIQMRSGGCIRNHSESYEDLKQAYRDTYSTFHTKKETEKEMLGFDEAVKRFLK